MSSAAEPECLFIGLYLDEMVPAWFEGSLEASDYDVLSAHRAGMLGATDEEHLAFAAENRRMLFTCNVADRHHNFVAIHARWLELSQPHAGILLCPQEQVSRNPYLVVARLQRFLDRFTADEVAGQILWLP